MMSVLVTFALVGRAALGTTFYVANAESRDIYAFRLDESTGASTLIEKVPVSGEVMMLAGSRDRRHLYACLTSKPYSVTTFAIEPQGGRLSQVETSPLADDMCYLRPDRSGRFLLGASYNGDKMSVNAISEDGRVDSKTVTVLPTLKNAHSIVTDLSNRFLFVANLGSDAILQFRFDNRTGKVEPNDPPSVATPKGAGPRHIVFHPNGRFAYCSDELGGTVCTYRLDRLGRLTQLWCDSVTPPSFSGHKPAAADIHLTPNGKFLYVSERASSTIAAFKVDGRSGKLASVGNYPTEEWPRGFNIDPSGRFLIAVGEHSNGMTTYHIDQKTGALSVVARQEVGKSPNWVEFVRLH